MNNFSVIIPVYNEEKNIGVLLDELGDILGSNYEYEIIVVDDKSTDGTVAEVIKKMNSNKKIKIKYHSINLGQSYCILTGAKQSIYHTLITMDGDGQNNPKDIPILLKKFFSNKNIKLLGGIRKKRKDTFSKKIASFCANKIRKKILNDNCDDTGCSLKIFDKNIFIQMPFFDGIHRFLPALFKGFGHKTLFIDVDHRKRLYGVSKYSNTKRLFRGIRDLFIVKKIIKNRNNV